MKKLYKNFDFKLFLALISAIASLFLLMSLYPGEIVEVYGDKSIEGAKVYVNDQNLGIMTWDEENHRTYARDTRFLGQFSLQIGLEKWKIKRDSMKVKNRGGREVDLKIITNDHKVYLKQYKNVEDIGYVDHYLKDFELVKN